MIYKFEHSIFHTLANLPFYQMNLIQKSFLEKLTAQIGLRFGPMSKT